MLTARRGIDREPWVRTIALKESLRHDCSVAVEQSKEGLFILISSLDHLPKRGLQGEYIVETSYSQDWGACGVEVPSRDETGRGHTAGVPERDIVARWRCKIECFSHSLVELEHVVTGVAHEPTGVYHQACRVGGHFAVDPF